jgi:hypothetical protein
MHKAARAQASIRGSMMTITLGSEPGCSPYGCRITPDSRGHLKLMRQTARTAPRAAAAQSWCVSKFAMAELDQSAVPIFRCFPTDQSAGRSTL